MLMRDHAADFPVQVMCETLGVSRSGYYAWASRDGSARAAADHAPWLPSSGLPMRPAAAAMAVRGCMSNCAPAAAARPDPPRRPRRAIRRASLSRPLAGARHALLDEPQGHCRDSAPMESFFATPKGKLVEEADYQTRDQARAGVFQYIEGFYNKRRLHSALGYITPEQQEAAFHSAATEPRNRVHESGASPADVEGLIGAGRHERTGDRQIKCRLLQEQATGGERARHCPRRHGDRSPHRWIPRRASAPCAGGRDRR